MGRLRRPRGGDPRRPPPRSPAIGRVAVAPGSEASVVLGSDALVRRLNRTYRGKDAPTNVLSFPFQRPPGAGPRRAGA